MGKKKVVQKMGDEPKEGAVAVKTNAGSSRKVENGTVYINATYNNTIITVTDAGGNAIAWSSAGGLGFAGPKKATPFAAAKVATAVIEKIKKSGPFNVHIVVKGVGGGRDSAVRTFSGQGFTVLSVRDATPIPHNGPRPPKVRRI
jgi:small subunit ribosomal protein S11